MSVLTSLLGALLPILGALKDAVLPVFSIITVGYLLASYKDVAVDPLNKITLYVLSPALVFHSLLTTEIQASLVGKLFGGVIAFTLAMVALTAGLGRLQHTAEPRLGAFILSSSFPNAGNYGIPLAYIAFNEIGRDTAILFIVAQNFLMYTLGIFIAARGTDRSRSEAMAEVFYLPLIYATVGAVIVRALITVPSADSSVMRILKMTGDAAIPVMLLLLGVQLVSVPGLTSLRETSPAVAIKLFVAPIVGLLVAVGMGILGDVGRVFVLATAMPVAITPLILMIEFADNQHEDGLTTPEYVGATILVSTILSLVTLPIIITLLRLDLLPF